MTKTYIVTGGAGFIGSNLAGRLIREGGTVYILDDLSAGFLRNVPEKAVFRQVDISRLENLLKLDLPDKVDAVYHMAAQSSGEASFDDPIHDIEVNYLATYNILKLAELKQCKRFVFASSMSVYGEVDSASSPIDEQYPCNPVSYYGCNKLASEKLIRVFLRGKDMKPTIFRFFNVYGPGQNMKNMKQGMASIYMSYLMKDVPVVVKGSLDRFRDFIYVDDLLDVLVKSESCTATHDEIFNVGAGTKTTVLELLRAMLKAFHKDDFSRWVIVQGSTPGDIKGFTADVSKLKAALGWAPRYDIGRGIKEMKSWIDKTLHFWKD
jgi:UDP-glucose 4-epimerase